VKIRVFAVHLVDHDQNWQAEFLGVTEGQLGPDLRPGNRIHHHERRIGHAHRVLGFAHEIHIAGSIQRVDFASLVLDRGQGGIDRQGARAFIFVEVSHRVAFFDFPHTGDGAGIEQQAFHQAGFTGALVAYQGNIPHLIRRIFLHSVKPPHTCDMSAFKRE